MLAAIERIGGYTAVAAALGCTKVAVWRWRRVPKERLAAFSRLAKAPQWMFRPDLRRKRK